MNGPAPLEDGYRRLLALYPAEHRHIHEEEMLGVLMTGARAGQRRPGLIESAYLIWGALKIWLRPGRDACAALRWRDALAVVSVALPLLFLVYFAAFDALSLASPFPDRAVFTAVLWSDGETVASWMILTVLVLLRLRRTAALATVGILIWYADSIAGSPNWNYLAPHQMLVFLALGLEMAALAASPGPRRGWQILTWKHCALVAAVAAVPGPVTHWLWPGHPAPANGIMITAIVASAAAMLAASPLSRRIIALLSVLACYFIVGLLVMPSLTPSVTGASDESGWAGPLRITLTCLPLAVIAGLAVAFALRSRYRAIPAGDRAA